MAFDIFVSGRGKKGGKHLSLSTKGLPNLDEWDLGPVTSHILTRMGVSAPPSPTGSAMKDALKAMASIEIANVFFIGLTGLLMHSPGSLSIHVRHTHLLWPTTGEFRIFKLDSASGKRATRTILSFLHKYEMNSWGVMMELAEVFINFTDSKYGISSGFYLNITLTD